MIDVNKHMPGKPKQLFLIAFIVFLASTALLFGILSYYKPLKPVLVKGTIDQFTKNSAGYNARLHTEQALPEARIKDKPYRFILNSKDTSTIWLAFPEQTWPPRQDTTGPASYLVQLNGIQPNHIADSVLNGELIVFRSTSSGLLNNLIK